MADVPFRAMSIRLPTDLAEELDLVASLDMMPLSVAIRTAITAHLAARRADPEFRRRLRDRLESDRRALERLAGDTTGQEATR